MSLPVPPRPLEDRSVRPSEDAVAILDVIAKLAVVDRTVGKVVDTVAIALGLAKVAGVTAVLLRLLGTFRCGVVVVGALTTVNEFELNIKLQCE